MTNSSQIALEVLNIDRIKTNQSRIHSYIQLRKMIAEHIWTALVVNDFFQYVESTKHRYDGFVVVFLSGSKSGFIDT